MLVAAEYCGSVGVGVTSPQYFCTDDGKLYVVKLQDNQLGLKVLVNEFIGAKFGEVMGLRFPPSDIIAVTEDVIHSSPILLEQGVSPGRHFASQYLDNAEYLGEHNVKKASNSAEMAGVILFDHMFHNPDRTNNKKNLLLRREDSEFIIYAIDNSHLFRSGKWTLDSLRSLGARRNTYSRFSFGILLKESLLPRDFLPYMEKVTKLTSSQIDKLIEEIPLEWLPEGAEKEELKRYIKLRCNMVEEIWTMLCKYIPQTRGGCRLSFFKRTRPVV